MNGGKSGPRRTRWWKGKQSQVTGSLHVRGGIWDPEGIGAAQGLGPWSSTHSSFRKVPLQLEGGETDGKARSPGTWAWHLQEPCLGMWRGRY